MSTKRVVPRERAEQDIQEAIDHYFGEGGPAIAARFIDELERAFSHLGEHPATGSSRYAGELGLPGLRSWPMRRFPHVIFYVEGEEHVDVWRVLQGQRDIPAWLR